MDKNKVYEITMDFYDSYKNAQRKCLELKGKSLLCCDAIKHSKSKKEDEEFSKEYRKIQQELNSNESFTHHLVVKFIESIEQIEVRHASNSNQ